MQEQGYVLSLDALVAMARRSGLTADAEHLKQLAPQLSAVLRNIHRLDGLDLSRYEPATVLHVWWE